MDKGGGREKGRDEIKEDRVCVDRAGGEGNGGDGLMA